MKTKKLVVGTVLCPKCNQKFRTKAPTPPTSEPQLTPRERDEHIRMLIMTPVGIMFLLLGFVLLNRFGDIDNLFSFINPLFLAPFFCGLFFLTPAMFAFLRKQNDPVGLNTQSHHHLQGRSETQPPVDRRAENAVMGFFGSMAIIMGVILVVFVIVALYIVVFFLTWIGENGLPVFSGW